MARADVGGCHDVRSSARSRGERWTDNAFYCMAACRRTRAQYNRRMKGTKRPDVERLPAELDRFLGDFFDRRDWQAEIKFDPAENRLFLDVRLETGRLSDDDRFFLLVEHFARAQRAILRTAGGLSFRCRLFAEDGADLTARLHQRGSACLDDLERGSAVRRRIAWLGFRRRLVRTVMPLAALWSGAVALIAGVIGLPIEGALLLAAAGVTLQTLLAPTLASRGR